MIFIVIVNMATLSFSLVSALLFLQSSNGNDGNAVFTAFFDYFQIIWNVLVWPSLYHEYQHLCL